MRISKIILIVFSILISAILTFFIINTESNENDTQTVDKNDPKEPVELTGKQLSETICRMCHIYPEPDLLNKHTWEKYVLPAMAYRLGIYDHDTVRKSLFGPGGPSAQAVKKSNIYPEKAMIKREQWKMIKDYYLTEAPETPISQDQHKPIEIGLKQFSVRSPSWRLDSSSVTYINIDEEKRILYLADAYSETLYFLNQNFTEIDAEKVGIGLTDIYFEDNAMYMTLMESFVPTNAATGAIIFINSKGRKKQYGVLQDHLVRPVATDFADLTGNGLNDFVVCEFGNLIGELSWFENTGQQIQKHTLRDQPGATKAYIHDFNQDNKPDIIALLGQGDEGIFMYYNQGNSQFREESLLRFPASYGSTYFELVDFNQDGYMDILYTAGDNADYTPLLKKYHGIYIYLNDGYNYFQKEYFFPLNGAYQAKANDFDQDGDLDIAAISFFPDYENEPEESFVYLENLDGDFDYKPFSFTNADQGKWIVFDYGDLDGDGDDDIVLGSFPFSLNFAGEKYLDDWSDKAPSILYLENNKY